MTYVKTYANEKDNCIHSVYIRCGERKCEKCGWNPANQKPKVKPAEAKAVCHYIRVPFLNILEVYR